MIIGVCSYGNTGSGALFDLLREYDELEVLAGDTLDFEFKYAYMPDGIEDLYFHLIESPNRWMSSDLAIKRFIDLVEYYGKPYTNISRKTNQKFYNLSMQFIDSIIQIKWPGRRIAEYFHKGKRGIIELRFRFRIHSIAQRFFHKDIKVFPTVQMYYSYNPEDFVEKAKKYLQQLLNEIRSTDKDKLVVDQPFSGDYPEKSFMYFDNPVAIVVDRDPRDLYITAKYIFPGEASWIPKDNVNDFIIYYKTMRSKKDTNDQRILYIRFEDLIYEYQDTKNRIEHFLGIHNCNEKKYFNPSISIRNTQLYNAYPDELENIKVIEANLKEWLYPFDKYEPVINHTGAF